MKKEIIIIIIVALIGFLLILKLITHYYETQESYQKLLKEYESSLLGNKKCSSERDCIIAYGQGDCISGVNRCTNQDLYFAKMAKENNKCVFYYMGYHMILNGTRYIMAGEQIASLENYYNISLGCAEVLEFPLDNVSEDDVMMVASFGRVR